MCIHSGIEADVMIREPSNSIKNLVSQRLQTCFALSNSFWLSESKRIVGFDGHAMLLSCRQLVFIAA